MAVSNGENVKVHYTGKLDSGEIFDSSYERDPIVFQVGAGMMIQGFNDAIIGMEVGEKKTVSLSPAQAYGEYAAENVVAFPKEQIPEGLEIQVGMQLQLHDQNGRAIPVTVKEVKDDSVVLDANHPLAGQTLNFEIELMEIGCELPQQHQHSEECSGCGDKDNGGGCCG